MGSVSPARCVPIVPADGYDETDEVAFIRLLCANRRPFVMTSSRRFGRGRESVCGDARKGLELRWSPGEQIIVDYYDEDAIDLLRDHLYHVIEKTPSFVSRDREKALFCIT